MFDFSLSYHEQMELVLWFAWWFIVVCRFFGMKCNHVVHTTQIYHEVPTTDTTPPVAPHSSTPDVVAQPDEPTPTLDSSVVEPECYDDYDSVLAEMMSLGIRQLKAMAKDRSKTEAPIKGYSRMTKLQLAEALLA